MIARQPYAGETTMVVGLVRLAVSEIGADAHALDAARVTGLALC